MHRKGHVSAGKRFAGSAASGLAAGALSLPLGVWQASLLIGWDTAAAVFILWVWSSVKGKEGRATAELATHEDDSRASAQLLLVGSSAASLVAVLLVLVQAADSRGAVKAALNALALVSVLLSWFVVQTVFMLHYANLYYTGSQGGMDFSDQADGETPRYSDFAYVAFTIGMTYQVSDTQLTSRAMRRSALHHALLSYLFGTMIVATMINAIASAIR